MRKVLISLVLCLSLVTTAFASPLKEIKDPKSLHIYMRKTFYYALDRIPDEYFEYFQIPAVFEYSRHGDCDDFAIYAWYHLLRLRYTAVPIVIIMRYQGEFIGHAITVFKEKDGTYSIFTNGDLVVTNTTDVVKAVEDIYGKYLVSISVWNPRHVGLITFEDFQKDARIIKIVNKKEYVQYKWQQFLQNQRERIKNVCQDNK